MFGPADAHLELQTDFEPPPPVTLNKKKIKLPRQMDYAQSLMEQPQCATPPKRVVILRRFVNGRVMELIDKPWSDNNERALHSEHSNHTKGPDPPAYATDLRIDE